jgi:hypothetical protein
MKKIGLFLIIFLTIFLSGCASGYKQFYKPADGIDQSAIPQMRYAEFNGNPIVNKGSFKDLDEIINLYAKKGYTIIGSSIFNSGQSESEDNAIKQAIAVQADLVVILEPVYSGSVTTSMPITTPTTSTSYSTGSATAYGANGPISVYGSSTTTTYGSQTTYMPMTVHRLDYGALYFFKQKYLLGIYIRDLNDSEKQVIQSNKGIAINIVVDDTPAYNADLLPNDIITALDGISITNQTYLTKVLYSRTGKEIVLSLVRNGEKITKNVKLN